MKDSENQAVYNSLVDQLDVLHAKLNTLRSSITLREWRQLYYWRNLSRIKSRSLEYYQTHASASISRSKKWYRKNHKHALALRRAAYFRNHDLNKEKHRRYATTRRRKLTAKEKQERNSNLREWHKKQCAETTDSYVRRKLSQYSILPTSAWPQALVDAEKERIKIKRTIKQQKLTI